jgi:hypothetical protein
MKKFFLRPRMLAPVPSLDLIQIPLILNKIKIMQSLQVAPRDFSVEGVGAARRPIYLDGADFPPGIIHG